MARKLDRHETTPVLAGVLPYRSVSLVAIIRLMTTLSSARFQQQIVDARALPDDPNTVPALFAIATGETRSPSALAVALHCSPATASRVIARLAASGLVVRSAHPDDRRSTVLTLTPLGLDQANALFAAGDRLMDRLLDDWSAADRAHLDRLLLRFSSALDREATGGAAATAATAEDAPA